MMKSIFLTFGVLAIFGLASVSAGLVDWFGDDGEDEILDRDRRQTNKACNISKIVTAAECSNLKEVFSVAEMSKNPCENKKKSKRETAKSKKSKRNKKLQPCSRCLLKKNGIIADGKFQADAYASLIGVSKTDETFQKNLADCNAALSGATENEDCTLDVGVKTHTCMLIKRLMTQSADIKDKCKIARLEICDITASATGRESSAYTEATTQKEGEKKMKKGKKALKIKTGKD